MILKILSFILLFTFGCLVQKTSYKPVMQITGIGDSTMAGVGVNNGEVIQTFSWNKYFDSFENEGVSGTPIEYWINNPDKRHLKTVIISIGFNNAKIESQSVTKIINLYKIMLSKIYAKRIYIIGIYPMDHSLSDVWYPSASWLTNRRLWQINEGIRDIAEKYGYFYVDTFSLFLDSFSSQAQEGKSYDGIHPSVEAYEDVISELKDNGAL